MYSGDDKNPNSGRLELCYHDGRPSYVDEGFLMENTEQASPQTPLTVHSAHLAQTVRVVGWTGRTLPALQISGVCASACACGMCVLFMAKVRQCGSFLVLGRVTCCARTGGQRPGVDAALHCGLPWQVPPQRCGSRSRTAGCPLPRRHVPERIRGQDGQVRLSRQLRSSLVV